MKQNVYSQTLAHYQPTMVQAINNADGTVSIIQMDPNNPQLITLPDGTQAQIRAVNTVRVCIICSYIDYRFILNLIFYLF